MRRRLTPALAATAALIGTLSLGGCTTPAPAPTPTPTGFASEAEAFAAAEETYRAYVDALNQVDLSDPNTFEPVFAFTAGDSESNTRRSLSEMHANGWRLVGATRTAQFIPLELDDDENVVAIVCSDVSSVDVLDALGASQVSPERPDLYELQVTLQRVSDRQTSFVISSSEAAEVERCEL